MQDIQNTNPVKTYTCSINSKWMWGLENAEISITTPKGGTATINKWNFDKCTDEQARVVWKVVGVTESKIDLTREEIQLFHDAALASKGRVHQAFKPKSESLTQRKFNQQRKSSIRSGICGCGGRLKTRDHGTWVGYFCPKCNRGSSYTKW